MHCPPKEKAHKKKGGKCCCGSRTLIKRLPYATISNKTADSDTGAPIMFLPDGTTQILWTPSAPPAMLQPASTCLNGPLASWFDVNNGQFTVQQTGLYSFTFTGNSVNTPGLAGYYNARLDYYSLVDANERCINASLPPTAHNEFSTPMTDLSRVTLCATVVLLAGDVIRFAFQAMDAGSSVPVPFIFEIDVVQLSRLDTNKVKAVTFA